MNKGIQIVSLILLFSVCGVAGYFIGGVFDKKELQTDNEVVPEDAEVSVAPDVIEPTVVPEDILSTMPEITNSPTPVKNKDNKTYKLIVAASVESGDSLVYYITKDDKGDDRVATNYDGEFKTLPHSSNGKYYVWVENTKTCERDHRVVSGFDPIEVKPNIKPLTAEDINESLNSTTDGFVPEKISNKFGPKHRVVNDDDETLLYDDFSFLWLDAYTFKKDYKYEVVDITLDDQSNKLVEIRVKVIKL
jgi:hypothetical protein